MTRILLIFLSIMCIIDSEYQDGKEQPKGQTCCEAGAQSHGSVFPDRQTAEDVFRRFFHIYPGKEAEAFLLLRFKLFLGGRNL